MKRLIVAAGFAVFLAGPVPANPLDPDMEIMGRLLGASPCIRLQNLMLSQQYLDDRKLMRTMLIGVLAGLALPESGTPEEFETRMKAAGAELMTHCTLDPAAKALEIFGTAD